MTRLFLKLVLGCLCWLLVGPMAPGNNYVRDWVFADGRKLRAELVGYNFDTDVVTLRPGEDEQTYDIDDFSLVDQAWLVEYEERLLLMRSKLEKLPGEWEIFVVPGEYQVELFIYWPSKAQLGEPLPALVIFDAAGRGMNQMLAHAEAAEEVGIVIIGCGFFSNRTKSEEDRPRYAELFPQLFSMPGLDPQRIFVGGTSGGALRAYKLCVNSGFPEVGHYPWAGVYANGGWLGMQPRRDYRSGMRIAMVNGNMDKGANRRVDIDLPILEAAGNEVALFSFEGGHQLPDKAAQIKSLNWLIGQDTVIE